MKSFIRFVVLSAFLVTGVSAHADSSRNCATLDQVKAQAEREVVASYERSNGVACVSQSADFSAGSPVRDSYRLVYACKQAREGAKITLLRVNFRDSQVRPFSCSELGDLDLSHTVEATDREF